MWGAGGVCAQVDQGADGVSEVGVGEDLCSCTNMLEKYCSSDVLYLMPVDGWLDVGETVRWSWLCSSCVVVACTWCVGCPLSWCKV